MATRTSALIRGYTHPGCINHRPGPGHPECPERLDAVLSALRAALPTLPWEESPQASDAQLARVHTPALIASVLAPFDGESRRVDEDTVLSPGSADAALRAAGAGIAAVDAVMAGEVGRAFCAVRPPGHHATADQAMGFCLFNSAAVAVAHALDGHGLQRVALVDFDVHHGNGSADIFASDPRVCYVSSHQSPLYPGSGAEDETGAGNLVHACLPPGTGSEVFRRIWAERLLPALEAFAPNLVVVSAGFDAHRLDPLADLLLEAEDYTWITHQLVGIADRHAQGRLVSLLEGGYSLTALRECSVAHVRALGD